MPNYRRNFVAGGTYFFTVVTDRRAKFLCSEAMSSQGFMMRFGGKERFEFEKLSGLVGE